MYKKLFNILSKAKTQKAKHILIQAFFSTTIFIFLSTAQAHENVVVVPLNGDDVLLPLDLSPTARISRVSPIIVNYIVNTFTVTDRVTQLVWQRSDDDQPRTWNEAWDYCANLNILGNTDWRLPNVTELQSLIDYSLEDGPMISFVFDNTKSSGYWTATNSVLSFPPAQNAWIVRFQDGLILPSSANNVRFVRCVI